MGSGPTRVTFHMALNRYLAKKPQSYTHTLDGFLGINPPEGYHYTDELFWLGLGILCVLWILFGNSPPFNISPFLLLVAGSDNFDAALKLCNDLSFVRVFAPNAADYLTSWDRLARDHVTDPSPLQTASRAIPKHTMTELIQLLEAVDIDVPKNTMNWKMTSAEHSCTRQRLNNYLLFGHAEFSADVPQFSALVNGVRYFDQLRILQYFVRHAFADFQSFIYVLYRDITVDPQSYLLLRVRWLPPGLDSPAIWTDFKNALSCFITRQGLPTLTSSAASNGLRAVYSMLDQSRRIPSIDSTIMSRPHVRRVILNIAVLGQEQPPSSMDFQVEIKPHMVHISGRSGLHASSETLVTVRVCFSRLTLEYGTGLHALAVGEDGGLEFDRIILASLLTSSSNFNTM
ncbi:hypothetical protein CALVIDRAFT_532067 [Calocera viscosa TUFC12733]|uniref:Uncharacterized protein n=1 Tax=Calocera viscosa (strain TUFC12733) TaxID=1330018 RepID=A0A167FGY4_CALVF|nr:hypothetical protein CALVIDRAFT_532067 [Calocera viscosa TUFC12733]